MLPSIYIPPVSDSTALDVSQNKCSCELISSQFDIFDAGDESEQTRYCFDIYDLNSDGYISRKGSIWYFPHIFKFAANHALVETDFSLIVQGGDAYNAQGEIYLNI